MESPGGEVKDTTVRTVTDEPRAEKPESALKSFLSGGVGGICVVLVGHPLDLIKVRMQTSGVTGQSVVGMFKNTLAKEGVRGLYRGVTAPLMAIAPIFAVCFWGYDMGQRTIRWAQPTSGDLSIQQKCIAGGLSAIPATALMAPSERVKVLLQTNAGKYSGSLDCAVKVLRDGGIRSLYKGTFATLLRDVPGSMAWFGVYEWTKIAMTKAQGIEDPSQLSPLAVLTAGGFAGIANWVVSIPPDVLKSRFQSAPPGRYSSLFDVYRQLMKTEGAGALFAGIRPAMLRAFPANAACFLGMEVARKTLSFMD